MGLVAYSNTQLAVYTTYIYIYIIYHLYNPYQLVGEPGNSIDYRGPISPQNWIRNAHLVSVVGHPFSRLQVDIKPFDLFTASDDSIEILVGKLLGKYAGPMNPIGKKEPAWFLSGSKNF